MAITIADGRGALWQWDTGRLLRVGSGVEQIYYQNKCFGRSVDVDVGDDGTAIIEAFATVNKRYQAVTPLTPHDIMLHSIGVPQPNAAAWEAES